MGKFERWILIHTYLKTIKQLPEDWESPVELKVRKQDVESIERYKKFELYLCKSEVMLNYFDGLVLSKYFHDYELQMWDANVKFESNKDYRKAQVTFSRTTQNLVHKGLIEIKGLHYLGQYINLTDKGRQKVECLLNIVVLA